MALEIVRSGKGFREPGEKLSRIFHLNLPQDAMLVRVALLGIFAAAELGPAAELVSSVHIRALDSFGWSRPSHFEFENVRVVDGNFELYAGSARAKAALERVLVHWRWATYRQATSPLARPNVTVLAAPLARAARCDAELDVVAHFYSPWHHNL